jgi:hypothetical protein
MGGHTMFARVTRLQVNLDKIEKVKNYFDKGVLPEAKLQKGFRSGILLTNSKTGNCITIGFWDTEHDALADEQDGHFQERLNMAKEFFVAPPVRELYEVASKY